MEKYVGKEVTKSFLFADNWGLDLQNSTHPILVKNDTDSDIYNSSTDDSYSVYQSFKSL